MFKYTILISLAIEIMQLVIDRSFDIDDLVINYLKIVIWYYIVELVKKLKCLIIVKTFWQSSKDIWWNASINTYIIVSERRDKMKLGDNILKLRKDCKLSQEQLAEKVDVTRQTISNWELCETSPNP